MPAPSLLSSWEFSETKFSEFLFGFLGYVKRRQSGKGSFNFHEVEMKLWDGFHLCRQNSSMLWQEKN